MEMGRPFRTAFTLIELLVVISIIVLLLSLLAPAMDKAIYAAELAMCGANIRTVEVSVQTYAFGNKRRYPDRMMGNMGSLSPNQILARVGVGSASTWYVDCRPPLEEMVKINEALNCPLVDPVDLENRNATDNVIYASYDLWYGYQFTNDPTGSNSGMYKVGDKWSWNGSRYNILVADMIATDTGWGYGSHPDKDGVWGNEVHDGTPNPWLGNGLTPVTVTFSWWVGGVRGPVDLNYGFDDGSVSRFDDVRFENDPRMVEDIPSYGDGYNTNATTLRKAPAAH